MSSPPQSVGQTFRRLGVGHGSTVLAAISGGPDSTALIRAVAARRTEGGFRLAACVVDHGIRPAADIKEDIAFLRDLCARLEVPLIVKEAGPGACAARARSAGTGLEEAARHLRYSFLRQAAEEAGAGLIVLGHTQDDVIETLLMRLLQGSDVHGLRGIAARRGPFVRPLLGCRRAEVVSWLQSLGQPWREDPTNSDTALLRNRVRHRLVPVLEAEFPGYRRGLAMLSQKLALSSDLARKLAGRLRWAPGSQSFSIAAEEFFAAHAAVRAWSLLHLYNRLRPSPGMVRRLPWRFLAPALGSRRKARGGAILSGNGMALTEDNGVLHWGRDIATRTKKGYFIVVSEARGAEIREAGVRVSFASGPEGDGSRGGIVILAEKVKPPLVLRSKRKGDIIRLAGGTTSVKDLLIGMKVPESERALIPILSDRSGVLAVLGGPRGYRTRIRSGVTGSPGETAATVQVSAHSIAGRGT
ncbi:MAG TPA: tRNA lysidine(34) synthetase TilS [Spirochaetia bacterium]|nr:tRNA lysidine(34) synthetase TilS [Spirochaetia bacterium]